MDENETYTDLAAVIDFAGFSFDKNNYREEELKILQPRLKARGYTRIKWMPGESDSFGPLSRLCECMSPDGNMVTFIYG